MFKRNCTRVCQWHIWGNILFFQKTLSKFFKIAFGAPNSVDPLSCYSFQKRHQPEHAISVAFYFCLVCISVDVLQIMLWFEFCFAQVDVNVAFLDFDFLIF